MPPEQPLSTSPSAAPRLLYVVTEDWAFLSHRLPMARAARDAGFEVHVATRVSGGAAAIEAERFTLHPIPFARGSLSPLAAIATIATLRRVRRDVKPALNHHVALQACVLGMLATLGQPAACVNAFIGLGYLFTSDNGKVRIVRKLVGLLLRYLVNRNNCITLVQNPDDMAALQSLGIDKSRIALIAGSGVDTDRFTPVPEPGGAPTFGFVGRLLNDKGIRTLIAAHRLLRMRVPDARLLIAGTPDPANPASVTEAEARSWNNQPGIAWFWAKVHVAVLPSRREGLPLSLMEAAACGRAMIASDVPGCREVVLHEQTGVLFPVDDAVKLADAMARLAADPQLRARYATTGRKLVVERFAADIVGRQIIALYCRLLEADKSPRVCHTYP
jgi:glycosyltransferase involved in cell wall biosynthesis